MLGIKSLPLCDLRSLLAFYKFHHICGLDSCMIKPVLWQVSRGAEWLACDHRIRNWYWNICVLTLTVSLPTSKPFLSQDTHLRNFVLQRGSFPRVAFTLMSSLTERKKSSVCGLWGNALSSPLLWRWRDSYCLGVLLCVFPVLLTLGLSPF